MIPANRSNIYWMWTFSGCVKRTQQSVFDRLCWLLSTSSSVCCALCYIRIKDGGSSCFSCFTCRVFAGGISLIDWELSVENNGRVGEKNRELRQKIENKTIRRQQLLQSVMFYTGWDFWVVSWRKQSDFKLITRKIKSSGVAHRRSQ